MKRIGSVRQLREVLKGLRARGKSVGFVPTMGYLHQGHVRLFRRARRENDVVAVSIFVNPLQFGPGEDYERYPRDLARDAAICRRAGVGLLFAPDAGELLRKRRVKKIRVRRFKKTLCAPFRPGHFDGVATIVALFFELFLPDRAYFGRKDYQQLRVIEELARREFRGRVRIVPVPTVRERSGLAVSSRNVYLNAAEKRSSAALYRALKLGAARIRAGCGSPAQAVREMRQCLRKAGDFRVQYLEIVDAGTLERQRTFKQRRPRGILIAAAVFLGRTRLIDNILV